VDAADLAGLRQPRDFPAISLVMPTHRHRPENRQDPIRLRSLLDEAGRRLRDLKAELPRGQADELLRSLEKAADQVDLQHAREALVLFAAPGGEEHAFVLPYVTVTERLVFDRTFATRDLVAAREQTWKYWVLALSEQPTRLWSGEGETLTEVDNALFPLHWGGVEKAERGTPNDSARRGEFFRQVERAMAETRKADRRPIVLLGVQRYLAYFAEFASQGLRDDVIGTVEGSFDQASGHELFERAAPVLAGEQRRRRDAALAQLEPARSEKRLAAGLEEVWELAGQGRIGQLMVEHGYLAPALIEDGRLLPADAADGEPVPDAVDELIEITMAAGGEVSFVPDDSLADHDRVAAVLRY
jgi:hypothetical protein